MTFDPVCAAQREAATEVDPSHGYQKGAPYPLVAERNSKK
jgi:hypothetical protein